MTNSWQVSTFSNVHQCPPRRDDKLVTVKRITQKYEKLILDNPTWSMERLKATVQEEMLAYVSISKCNRAKSTVMSKILDAREGEHSRVIVRTPGPQGIAMARRKMLSGLTSSRYCQITRIFFNFLSTKTIGKLSII